MKFSNVLHSGFDFTDAEHEQRLQYILFNSLLVNNIALVSLVGILRFITGDTMQGVVDFSYCILGGIIFFIARKSKKYYLPLARFAVVMSFIIVSLTFKISLGGLAGIGWYSILVLTAFFLLDKKCAYVISGISLLMIIYLSSTSTELQYTAANMITGIFPLLITVIFLHFYETRNSLMQKRLRFLNTQLDEKVHNTKIELSSSEEKLRNLVENLSDWVWEMDKDGIYSYSSSSIQQILGYEPSEVEGSSHRNLLFIDAIQENEEFLKKFILKQMPFKDQVVKTRHKTGHLVMLEVSAQPIIDSSGIFLGYRGVSRDITKRLSTEKDSHILKEQLHQAQKMEAIGTLAGGIAHDFNNILSAIIGYAEIAKVQLSDESKIRNDIDQVIVAGKRATELVRQILTFSRKSDQQEKPLRMDLIVREALKMLRSSLPTTIDIQTKIDPESGLVLAAPTNIHQIVMNLCTNASHAIGNGKGLLEVNLNQVYLDAEQIVDKPQVEAGSFIVLMVKDNGTGMDEKTIARIFEPYFTTKKQEEGTGLGLAVIHGIVEEAKGFIQMESHLGSGTCFHIYLPNVEDENSVTTEPEKNPPLPTGKERILIIDDEPDLTEVAKIHLRELGYFVTTKTKSREALEVFLATPDSYDLVITDQTMPDITGSELAQAMLKVKPDLPIILYTGYTSALSENEAYALGIQSFIEKPMSKELLAKTVRRLLDKQ